jgi:hypothetical protein
MRPAHGRLKPSAHYQADSDGHDRSSQYKDPDYGAQAAHGLLVFVGVFLQNVLGHEPAPVDLLEPETWHGAAPGALTHVKESIQRE